MIRVTPPTSYSRTRALVASITLCLASQAIVPACEQYHVYWGDLHGHTALSDGRGTPADYFQFARDQAALDFVIVTDHDFGTGPSWRLPPAAWTLLQDEADRFNSDNRFVAIAGYEWTSDPKYWKDFAVQGRVSEGLFDGPVKSYNHKAVYFPSRTPDIFRSKDAAFRTPDLLAEAVASAGGLAHNCHPGLSPGEADQWDYQRDHDAVICNTEIGADVMFSQGKRYEPKTEQAVREFLTAGGLTGFVAGSDTHEGHASAHTAILARSLTREGVFEALRARRTYAISNARIQLDFRIGGHFMGEQIETSEPPQLSIHVQGTAMLAEVEVIRDGEVLSTFKPDAPSFHRDWSDDTSKAGSSWYYIRVTQSDADRDGNPSRAWSSPIWVQRR